MSADNYGRRSAKFRASLRRWRQEAFTEQNGCCYWCGLPMARRGCTADHKIELSKGGAHSRENIVAACNSCNHGRSNQPAKLRLSWQETRDFLLASGANA